MSLQEDYPSTLLVPIRVDALVIDASAIELFPAGGSGAGRWSPAAVDLGPTVATLGAPGPAAFQGTGSAAPEGGGPDTPITPGGPNPDTMAPSPAGVYLRWLLPAGLKRPMSEGGAYPPLPDRWVVARLWRESASAAPQVTGWALVPDAAPGSDDAPLNLIQAQGEARVATSTGAWVDLGEALPPSQLDAPLTALGSDDAGRADFSSAVMGALGVTAFCDALSDAPTLDGAGASASYVVLGLYSDQGAELRAALVSAGVNDSLDALLDALGLDAAGLGDAPQDDGATLPLALHGALTQLNFWDRGTYQSTLLGTPSAPIAPGVSGDGPQPAPVVSIGSLPSEAVATLLAEEGAAPLTQRALELALEGRVVDLLHDWSEDPQAQERHLRSFRAHAAAQQWSLPPSAIAQASPAELGAWEAALIELNALQAEADAASADLASAAHDLYAGWWVCAAAQLLTNSGEPPFLYGDLSSAASDWAALTPLDALTQAAQTQAKHAGAASALKEVTEGLVGAQLTASPAAFAYTPADPVVAISGLKAVLASDTTSAAGPTPWRSPSALITEVDWIQGGQTTAISQTPACLEAGGALDAALQASLPDQAELLLALLGEAGLIAEGVSALATQVPLSEQNTSGFETWLGALQGATSGATTDPAVVLKFGDQTLDASQGLYRLWGCQPWSPRYLDWEVVWTPSVGLGDWAFGDSDDSDAAGDADYTSDDGGPGPVRYTLRGRSLLTPMAADWIPDAVDALDTIASVTDDGSDSPTNLLHRLIADDVQQHSDDLAALEGDVIVQSLGGLRQALLGRDPSSPAPAPDAALPWSPAAAPYDDASVASALGPLPAALSDVHPAPPITSGSPAAPSGPPPYSLLQAGQLQLTNLWLVDDFGQWEDVLVGDGAQLLLGPSVSLSSAPGLVGLPPRLAQPASLKLSHDPDMEGLACGWLVYNHLDGGLVVYDSGGALLGELLRVNAGARETATWEPLSGDLSTTDIPDPTLQAFVAAMLDDSEGPPPLLALLALIDESLPVIRPSAHQQGAALRRLAGRPLALVPATLELALQGPAWADPLNPDVDQDAALAALSFPLQLGSPLTPPADEADDVAGQGWLGLPHPEDGLIAAFLSDGQGYDFSQLLPRPQASTDGGGFFLNPSADTPPLSLGQPLDMALLIDPLGHVQASVGVVPEARLKLPARLVRDRLDGLPLVMRAEPLLLRGGALGFPSPAVPHGSWGWLGPDNSSQAPILPPSPKPQLDGSAPGLVGGHLVFTPDAGDDT